AEMFLHRRPLKSVAYDREKDQDTVEYLRDLVDQAHFDKEYFTMTNRSSDISYDYKLKEKAPISLIYEDGKIVDLSEVSPIVESLSDNLHGNDRLYVPRELLRRTAPAQQNLSVFQDIYNEFRKHI